MAPLTRYRADDNHVHDDLALKYYTQRASMPGTLLIAEGTYISPEAGGSANAPGIYNAEQIAGWKRITDAVHAKGSFMYVQLWATGRTADPEVLKREGNFPYVSASSKRLPNRDQTPRALTVPEIQQYVHSYAQAARNAIEAGFDGVEIQAANGHLVDQFLQDVTNERNDEYGGSVERRSRFVLEVVKAVVEGVGKDRVVIKFSFWGTFHVMRMADPIPQFLHVVQLIRDQYPGFAYIHLLEPPIDEATDTNPGSNDTFRKIWTPKPFLSAGGHTPKSAPRTAAEKGDVIVFGQYFILNPNLPRRLRDGIPLAPVYRNTLYLNRSPVGYVDYPFARPQNAQDIVQARL